MAQINKPNLYFNTVLYTGDGTTNQTKNITFGFQPDWSWFKSRDAGNSHVLVDAVRGGDKMITSESTNAEITLTATQLFTSTGMTISNDASQANSINSSGSTKVCWGWLGANGTASNTDGSITSTVSANTTSGFSIVSYTGTGSAATIGHGLGSAPAFYIIKQRNTTGGWIVYHKGNTSSPETDYLRLDKTDITVDDAIFNDTAPTSSVFSIGTNAPVNTSGGTYIAYCFAEKKGFSKAFSYTGNGSADGSFCYLGFKPAFIICRDPNNLENWFMFDNKRPGYNVNANLLYANDAANETTSGANQIDLLSNGFKMRATNNGMNRSGATFIGFAFAESPLVGTNDTPATAR